MSTISLDRLRFGHEAVPPFNARRTGRDTDIEPLAHSLQAHGLIHPLVVKMQDGDFFVADGNRRLAALQLLAGQGAIAADAPIECAETDADAGEISLAANVMRMPLHEADQYEAFTGLADQGLSEPDIAGRFGIEPARVRRILALGRLSPVVLHAWREGRFEREAGAIVRAFTLAPSLEAQEQAFAKLADAQHLYPHYVMHEFGAGSGDASRHLTFVGTEAYAAAGGVVVEDLFGTNHAVTDPALAKSLADAKLAEECTRLISEGWSWAILDEELPQGASYSWDRIRPAEAEPTKAEAKQLKKLETALGKIADDDDDAAAPIEDEIDALKAVIAARAFSAEDRARAGCTVAIGHRGDLSVRYGLIRPAKVKAAAAKAAGEKPEKAEPKLSNALHERLSLQLTEAAQAAIVDERRVALAALLAGFLAGKYGDPVQVSTQGHGGKCSGAGSYDEVFSGLAARSIDELLEVAGAVVATTLTLRRQVVEQPPLGDAGIAALCNAIDSTRLLGALRERFDAADYFGGANKTLVLRAIEEAINPDEARKIGTRPKPEIVAFAIANVPQTGWLPPELRIAAYAEEER